MVSHLKYVFIESEDLRIVVVVVVESIREDPMVSRDSMILFPFESSDLLLIF